MEIRFKPIYVRTAKVVHTNGFSRNVFKLGSIKVLSERRRPFIQMCFRKGVEISFKQGHERTAKSIIQTCFREKCEN